MGEVSLEVRSHDASTPPQPPTHRNRRHHAADSDSTAVRMRASRMRAHADACGKPFEPTFTGPSYGSPLRAKPHPPHFKISAKGARCVLFDLHALCVPLPR